MAEHIITLADHEARRLAEAGTLLVVRPIKSLFGSESWDAQFAYEGRDGPSLKAWAEASPLGVPGDVLVCKEAWLFTGLRTVYRATDPQWGEICEWNPASTMPRRAVRFRPVVCEAGVMRIDDITYGQCIDMGLDMSGVEYEPGWDTAPLVRYWNRRFRKYPWEDNPWCWFARVERENDHA
jgi:hypothetical protein